MIIPYLLLAAFISPVVALYLYRILWCFREFSGEGIPGPKPNWLFGNVDTFGLNLEEARHLTLTAWTKKFGKTYVYYEGSQAILVTSDIEFIAHVFIKQAQSFNGRKMYPFQADPNSKSYPINMMDARCERWKRMRTISTPMFSIGKLKAMAPLMAKCQKDFMAAIDDKYRKNEELNILDLYRALTLATIGETALGIELNSPGIHGKDNITDILDSCKLVFRASFNQKYMLLMAVIFPELHKIFHKLELMKSRLFGIGALEGDLHMIDMMNEIVRVRRYELQESTRNRRADFLQMLIDVEESDIVDPALLAGKKKLTANEISGQVFLVLTAGCDTTSTALLLVTFCLSKYPHVQEKLIQEIDEYFWNATSDANYESIQNLQYLDAVINETLRLYSLAPLTNNRISTEDTEINGIRIPKGVAIQPDLWSLHRNEEQWGPVDVESFYPERFFSDYPTFSTRIEAAFMPFGLGPRICIGQRFALLHMKMTIVNLLRKYRFELSEKTPEKLDLLVGVGISPKEDIWVKLALRNDKNVPNSVDALQ